MSNAIIRIQNLPQGAKVSSPKEAHQGQVDYELNKEEFEIVEFFPHDSFLHMHLITKDEKKMGHLDKGEFGDMKLFLPKK